MSIYERPIDAFERASIYKSWLAGRTINQLEAKFKRGAWEIRSVIRSCKRNPPAIIKNPFREQGGEIN